MHLSATLRLHLKGASDLLDTENVASHGVLGVHWRLATAYLEGQEVGIGQALSRVTIGVSDGLSSKACVCAILWPTNSACVTAWIFITYFILQFRLEGCAAAYE